MTKPLLAAVMAITAAIIAVASFAAPQPHQGKFIPIKNVQTVRATTYPVAPKPDQMWFVEQDAYIGTFCWICSCWHQEESGNIYGRTQYMRQVAANF